MNYRTFVLLSIVLISISEQTNTAFAGIGSYETKQIGRKSKASYYTEASCREEGTSGICANGERLDDRKYTCASWKYRFGTLLKVTNEEGRSIVVRVTDRGPGRKALKRGVTIDLTSIAFAKLAPLRKGVIWVTVDCL